jgi:hypothetical protein
MTDEHFSQRSGFILLIASGTVPGRLALPADADRSWSLSIPVWHRYCMLTCTSITITDSGIYSFDVNQELCYD